MDSKDLIDRVTKLEDKLADQFTAIFRTIHELREAQREAVHEAAFQEGVEWFRKEIGIVAHNAKAEPETTPIKPASEMTEAEKIGQEALLGEITQKPGMRDADVIRFVTALPVKPTLTENSIKGMLRRLVREKKIENKFGRYYAAGVKSKLHDYQVMSYMPDGSKYLGSDITR